MSTHMHREMYIKRIYYSKFVNITYIEYLLPRIVESVKKYMVIYPSITNEIIQSFSAAIQSVRALKILLKFIFYFPVLNKRHQMIANCNLFGDIDEKIEIVFVKIYDLYYFSRRSQQILTLTIT